LQVDGENVIERMRGAVVVGLVLVMVLGGAACGRAQGSAGVGVVVGHGDLVGDWQGTLVFPGSGGQAGAKFRLVLRIAKEADGSWSAVNYSIDQGPAPMHTSGVSLKGTTFRFAIPLLGGSYEGRVSADGETITGAWTQGSALPLNFVRATKETAWEIPSPAPKVAAMAADADPKFEVVTIKPTAAGVSDRYFRVYGQRFMTQDTSLAELMEVAYGVDAQQIVGAPGWVNEEKFDVVGVPEGVGEPNGAQWTGMVQKMLVERFGLRFHRAKKEMLAYVISVGKDGAKGFVRSESANPLPGLEFSQVAGGLMLPARNATLGQFAAMMQTVVLDRPVVDQTGMVGRFDFQLKFMPDEGQFGGHPPKGTEGGEVAPGLGEAMEQQLGLRLSSERVAVEVLVVDGVERPSAN
jgi:uncharacterized protein (TIGR03435 family)